MKFTEEQLRSYAQPLSKTEEQKCKNAIKMLRDALLDMGYSETTEIKLAYKDTLAYTSTLKMDNNEIKLLVQGSYANNTNVRTESDVDVAIIQENVFNTEYRLDVDKSLYNFETSDYTYDKYKRDIYDLLVNKFGEENVIWRDKCILVHGNSYRVDADGVPARRYKNFKNDYNYDPENYIPGIVIYPDSGGTIINYPEQHIKNGKDKNVETNYFYKKMVRIIKKMRYLMISESINSAKNVNSFMLESLLWNIPEYKYITDESYIEKFQGIINYIIYIGFDDLDSYKEANNIKQLCENLEEKNNIKEFIIDLKKFFTY